jgi:hypothetical protein
MNETHGRRPETWRGYANSYLKSAGQLKGTSHALEYLEPVFQFRAQ